MHRLTVSALPSVLERFKHLSRSSLFALTSRFGNSRSELEQQLEDASSHLYLTPDEVLLLEIAHIDHDQSAVRFQLCGTTGLESLRAFLNGVIREQGVNRLYSYVFPWETDEIDLLTRLGFEREAVLRQHLFLAGAFQDIEVYGRLEEVA